MRRSVEQMVPRLATFSTSARCVRTGQLGVGISTKFIAVGALAPNARAQVGACSSQAFVNPYHRYWMIENLSQGQAAQEALRNSLAKDPRPQLRQLAIVDAQGFEQGRNNDAIAICLFVGGHRSPAGHAGPGHVRGPARHPQGREGRVYRQAQGSQAR